MKKMFTLLLVIFLLQGGFLLNGQVLESDSLALVDIYNASNGPSWTSSTNWLTGKVVDWPGVTVTNNRVTKLLLNGMGLTGTLSASIGKLTELDQFEINNGEGMTGSIPLEIWNCTKIKRLQLKFTGLTGGIPAFGISKMTVIGEINFQGTKLGGSIPDSVFTLPSLIKAYLHESGFTGAVPATLSQATKLERLYLHKNRLTSLPYVEITNKQGINVELTGNFFTFAQVKPYVDCNSVTPYAKYTNDYQFAQDTTTVTVKENFNQKLSLKVTDGDYYSWFKDPDYVTPLATDSAFTLYSVALTDAGNYVCKVQSDLVASSEIRTVYVLKVTPSTGIASSEAPLSVSATIISDNLQIKAASEIDEVCIYNISGQKVLELDNVKATEISIPAAGLSKGIYLVSVKSANSTSVKKVIKK